MRLSIVTKDMHGDKTNGVYQCEKKENNLGVNYKYIGEDGIKNDIYFLGKKVLINRTGDITTNLVCDLEKVTKSLYKTPYLTTELSIKTLRYEKVDKGYKLTYQLFAEADLLNEIIIEFNEI